MKKILQILAYLLFLGVFLWVSAQLFFQRQTDAVLASLFSDEVGGSEMEVLRVMYPDEAFSLEPTSFNPTNRQRLLNVYEPLVAVDRDLNFEPALALSWGRIDDLTWEFRLRPGVKFHDGSDFDVDDVLASFDRAREFEASDLKYIFDSIEKVRKLDEMNLEIVTKRPDPLLIQKVSQVLIFPAEYVKEELMPVLGTGPYVFSDWAPGVEMLLIRNENYWSYVKSKFKEVHLFVSNDKSERVNRFLAGEVDLLAFVPFDAAEVIAGQGFDLTAIPSLELQFLVFNQDSEKFDQREEREAFASAIDRQSLLDVLGAVARPVNQYVSNGVFGYNPDIEVENSDVEKLIKKVDLGGATVKLHLPIGLDVLGEHVRTQLKGYGVNVVVSYLNYEELNKSFVQGLADVYFLGYKAESGDASEFFQTLIHSKGDFNIANFKNNKIDQKIEVAVENLDPVERLGQLRELMEFVVDDYFGVPLFEYEVLFAYTKDLNFQPRIDGVIYFDQIDTK